MVQIASMTEFCHSQMCLPLPFHSSKLGTHFHYSEDNKYMQDLLVCSDDFPYYTSEEYFWITFFKFTKTIRIRWEKRKTINANKQITFFPFTKTIRIRWEKRKQ